MLVVVFSGFVIALMAPWLQRHGRGAAGWIIALLPLGLTLVLIHRLTSLAPGEAWQATYPWVPSLGLSLTFYADGLSLLFALLICGVGTIVVVYTGGYLAGHPHLGRLYAYLLMFMASMLGLVFIDNVLTLYVFWELTSISSYLLIGFEHERAAARDAALQALLVTSAGGLALLVGMILLGYAGESWTLSLLLARGEAVQSHPFYLAILLLTLAGVCTKSAQMPFHFWLPSAMEAPTPVSAYLHAATMVKAGIYLLARLTPVLGGTAAWQASVTMIGVVTMLVGGCLAFLQTDMKRVLAYSTVSALGMLTLLLGLGTAYAVQASLTYLLAHAFYKGALFLVAGTLEHETGTRDVTQLGGLVRRMPLTAVAATLAALSMAGLPPLLGFVGKELVYETALSAPFYRVLLSAAVVATGVLFVAVAGVVGARPFWGRRRDTPQEPHGAPFRLWLGPFCLAAAGLAAGVWCMPFGSTLLTPAVSAVLQHPETVALALWHGWTVTLLLSLASVLLGVGLYAKRHAVSRGVRARQPASLWGPARGYERLLAALYRLADVQTRVLQSGYLRYYLTVTIACTVGLVGWTLVQRGEVPRAGPLGSFIYVHEAWLAILIVVASVVTIRSRSRLAAIAALGVVGYSVALLFVLLGAPDLAITQFLIETLMVILFVLVVYHLPSYTLMSPRRARVRDAIVALTTGCLITALVLVSARVQWYESISQYFVQHSKPEAHGRNIVNVILVDFRGLDTLGEMTVLAVAALGVFALIRLRLSSASNAEEQS